MKGFTRLLVTAMLFATVGLFGCADDGSDGVAGVAGASAYEIAVANGFTGTEAEWLATANANATFPVEACATCHADGKSVGADVVHAATGAQSMSVSDPVVTEGATDLVVTFTVELDGVPATGYDTLSSQYRLTDVAGAKNRITLAGSTLAATATAGEYTITLPGAVTAGINAEDSRYLFRIENSLSDVDGSRAIVLFDYPAAPIADVLSATGETCANCHSSVGTNMRHYSYPPNNGKNCTVCHDAENTNYPYLNELVHGIHASANNYPSGTYTAVHKDATTHNTFSIAFPSYMNNCTNCHEAGVSLDAAIVEPVSYDFCMTCHEDWTGFDFVDADGVAIQNHSSFTPATNCAACHEGTVAPADLAGMHNNSKAGGMTSGRGGLIHDGIDASVTEGARVDHQITGVVRTGDDLAITWTATVDGITPVDPCNTTAAADAPTFNAGYSVLKAFFQGDDLANADNGASSPGQANSTNLDFTAGTGNTVCVGNEATTTITLTAAEAALTGTARVALQGKPKLLFAPASLPGGTTIQVRAKSPVYDFALADGAAAAARRNVTDTDKCLGCHKGSLYQHGGNRVDNVDLCVMCHNEASSEQNVREGYGVDATEAYDGKSGQTYGFKSMLHAFHASGEATKPIVIYRSFGIYAFAPTRDMLPNWPGEGSQVIFGSDDGTGTPISKTHNFFTAHYPRNLNDCSACHTSSFSSVPDQTQAIATTVYAGAAPWDNQLNDALQGPAAAACLSCHQSAAARSHAYKEGWFPTYFENGRQTILDAAK